MPINVRIPDDLRDDIDAVRGKIKREPFIRTTLAGVIACPSCGARPTQGCQKVSPMYACQRPRALASHDDTGAPTS